MMRARVLELGISHETLDAIAGWQSGYASKLLAKPPIRQVGLHTLFIALGSLGLAMRLEDDPQGLERLRTRMVERNPKFVRAGSRDRGIKLHFTADFLKQIRAEGGRARMAKLSPRQRTALARKANRIRWRDVKAQAGRGADKRPAAAVK